LKGSVKKSMKKWCWSQTLVF